MLDMLDEGVRLDEDSLLLVGDGCSLLLDGNMEG